MTLSAEHLEKFVDDLLAFVLDEDPDAYALTVMRFEALADLAQAENCLEAKVCCDLIESVLDLIPIANDPLHAAVQLRSQVLAILAAGGCFGRVIPFNKKDY